MTRNEFKDKILKIYYLADKNISVSRFKSKETWARGIVSNKWSKYWYLYHIELGTSIIPLILQCKASDVDNYCLKTINDMIDSGS